MIALSEQSLLLGLGLLLLLATWAPMLLQRLPLSLPILFLGLGYALSWTRWVRLSTTELGASLPGERLVEMIVLFAIMGAGLRLERKFGWRRWGPVWRLLLIAMPLTMVAMAAIGVWVLGFALPAAVLLAAVLAPTDPVLAAEVQSGPPGSGDDGHARFGLTAEAGINDALAFPFVLLALAMQAGGLHWTRWLTIDFLGEAAAGVAIGLALGCAIGALMFRLPWPKLSESGEGLAAIGTTLVCYGLTVLLHGNGFVAVFVAAVAIRSTRPEDSYHATMAEFAGQVERVLVMLVLLLFGWGLGNGLLRALDARGVAAALALIFVVRPAAALIGFHRSPLPTLSHRLMAFFGIRGIGTIFYLQYAFNRGDFPERDALWAVCGFTVLCSVLIHGVLATPLMARADRLRERVRARGEDATPV